MTPTATMSFGDVTPLMQQDPDPLKKYRVRVTPSPYDGTDGAVLFDSGEFSVTRLKRSIYLLLDNFGPTGKTLRVANVTAVAAENFANQKLATSLRVSNMIPDTDITAVDVYLGGVLAFPSVPYGCTPPGPGCATTTAYLPVPNGPTTVTITRAGTPPDPPNTPADQKTDIASGPLTIVGGQGLTLYASGRVSDKSGAFVTVVESLRSITGQAQLRFVAAAPSAGAIDVYLVTPGQPISDTGPILASAGLLANKSVNLTPGTYDIFVTRAGTSVELLGPERISVDAGNVYDAVLFDAPGGGSPLSVQVTPETLP
jgi:hypothetical protein